MSKFPKASTIPGYRSVTSPMLTMSKTLLPVCTWVLLSAIALPSFAQDLLQLRIAGKAERASDELIDRGVKDANGELCAGLVVVSDLEGLSFDSNNGIVKSNTSAGRMFLFLSPGERTVTIAKSGYKPLKLVLVLVQLAGQIVDLKGILHRICQSVRLNGLDEKPVNMPVVDGVQNILGFSEAAYDDTDGSGDELHSLTQ